MGNAIKKQPYEEFFVGVDFSSYLDVGGGETLDGADVSETGNHVLITDKNGNDVTEAMTEALSTQADAAMSILKVKVVGGDVTLSPYKISFRCKTIAPYNQKFEADRRIVVVEK